MNRFLVFLLLPLMVFPQDSLFQQIGEAYSKLELARVKELVSKVDENKITLKNKNDSIRFSIFNIIKFYVTDYKQYQLDANNEIKHRYHLNYLYNNGYENILPSNYINYFQFNSKNKEVYPYIINFLERGIETEKKILIKVFFKPYKSTRLI